MSGTLPDTTTDAGAASFRESLAREDAAGAESGAHLDADTRAAYQQAMSELEGTAGVLPATLDFLAEEEAEARTGKKTAPKVEEPEDTDEEPTDTTDAEEKPAEEAVEEEAPAPAVPVTETPEYQALAAEKQALEAQLQVQEERDERAWAASRWATERADELLERLAKAEGWDQDKVELFQLRAAASLERALQEAPEVGAAKKAREGAKAKAEADAKAKTDADKVHRASVVKGNLSIAMAEVPGVSAKDMLAKYFDARTGVFDTAKAKADKAKAKPATKPKVAAATKTTPKPGRTIPLGWHKETAEWLQQEGILDQYLE